MSKGLVEVSQWNTWFTEVNYFNSLYFIMMQTCGDINEQKASRSQLIKIYYLQRLTIK